MSGYLTAEELEQQDREKEGNMKDIGIAIKAIMDYVGEAAGGGHIDCPICKNGQLSFAVCGSGLVYARCSTDNCIFWME